MAGAKKSTPLGPRVTVEFGKKTKTGKNPRYIFVLKSVSEFFGFKSKGLVTIKTKTGAEVPVRGAKGAGSVRVPVTKSSTTAKKGVAQKYKSIPVPAGATIKDTIAFLKTATKNKPDRFITRDGRVYPIDNASK